MNAFDRITSDDDTLLFVDFDYTLFTSNSTELFIALCKPSAFVALIDLLIRRCIPWRLTGIEKWFRLRDYICILVIVMLTPWNFFLWKRRAPLLFSEAASPSVLQAIEPIEVERLVIISFGMQFVIKALVAGSRFAHAPIVATPILSSVERFRTGKRELALAAYGEDRVKSAALITDSQDDADLLAICRHDILIDQQGPTFDARQRLYLPTRYMSAVKFVPSFVLDQLLLVDSFIYILSTATDLRSFLHRILICPLLVLSQSCIYELGYFENDTYAARREAAPALSGKEARFQSYPIGLNSWLWSILLAAAAFSLAVWLGEIERSALAVHASAWIGALIAIRLLFFVYNRLPTKHRISAYPFLQIGKYGAVLAVFPATLIGGLLMISQIAMMWIVYIVYRLGGNTKAFNKEEFRTLFFAAAALLLAIGGHGEALFNPFVWAIILAWSVLRIVKSLIMKSIKQDRPAT